MNKHSHSYGIDILFWVLAAACLILAAAVALLRPAWLIPVAALVAAAAVAAALNVRALRRMLAQLLHGTGYADSATQHSLAKLSLPVVVASGRQVLWYNDAFRTDVLNGTDACLLPLDRVVPALEKKLASAPYGQNITHAGRCYTVFGSGVEDADGLFVAYFVDDTALKHEAGEYWATRPSVMLIAVDTYDDVLRELKDSERARIAGEIDLALEEFIDTTSGFLRRISVSRYLAVVEERHMKTIIDGRFAVLDRVRGIGGEGEGSLTVTLSIGVGRGGTTLHECEDMAAQALDMALGRGGDQAAVKSADGFEFYGGVSRGVEKRSRVRSRIIANALNDLIAQSESVLILGHRVSDLDSLGAAAGIWRLCRIAGKPASIVVDEHKTLAENLVALLRQNGCDIIRPEGAENLVNDDTLVVIADTHMASMLENPAVYAAAKNVVVIDHHRRCVGYIENAVIFYHETTASSASELVTELIQYTDAGRDDKLTPVEAQALLAGIMLDTRHFALNAGVRTFEAAAYLRRMGAQTVEVKKLFNASFESYAWKAKLVTEAELFLGCAVVAADGLPEEMQVVVPQAANDLLSIDGVDASFVAVETGGQVLISARSFGAVNVQVVMEQLGGGGHLTMAGTQLQGVSLAEAKQRLLAAISHYRDETAKKDAR